MIPEVHLLLHDSPRRPPHLRETLSVRKEICHRFFEGFHVARPDNVSVHPLDHEIAFRSIRLRADHGLPECHGLVQCQAAQPRQHEEIGHGEIRVRCLHPADEYHILQRKVFGQLFQFLPAGAVSHDDESGIVESLPDPSIGAYQRIDPFLAKQRPNAQDDLPAFDSQLAPQPEAIPHVSLGIAGDLVSVDGVVRYVDLLPRRPQADQVIPGIGAIGDESMSRP